MKRYRDDRNLPYPAIDPETGELVDGVSWMTEVRELRAEKKRRKAQAFPNDPDQ